MTNARREHLLAVIDRITDLRELPAFADQLHLQNELSPEIQGAIAHRLARLTRLKAGR